MLNFELPKMFEEFIKIRMTSSGLKMNMKKRSIKLQNLYEKASETNVLIKLINLSFCVWPIAIQSN